MIKLQKDRDTAVCYRDLYIMKDGKYMGFIYKMRKSKKYPWTVILPGIFQCPNNEFRTLKEARLAVKKALEGGDNV